jgi:polar amino acid transport system substrate-binding protein
VELNMKQQIFVKYSFVFLLFKMLSVDASQPLLLATSYYPPYEYTVNGKIQGLSVEVVEAVFQRMEQPIELIELPFSRALKYLENGKVDGAFQLIITAERRNYTDFSNEIIVNETVSGFALSDSLIDYSSQFEDMAGLRIAMLQDFSYGVAMDEAIAKDMFRDVKRLTNATDMFLLLASNHVDLVIGDVLSTRFNFELINQTHQYPMIKKHTADIEVTPTYLGFSAKNKLSKIRDAFDLELKAMKLDGSYQQIVNRWHNK